MSSIRRGDERLHHSDWSHRWSGGPADDAGQAAYQAALQSHMDEHRAGADVKRRPTSPRPPQRP